MPGVRATRRKSHTSRLGKPFLICSQPKKPIKPSVWIALGPNCELVLYFADHQRSSPRWSDSLHFKQFELFLFAMWQAFAAADYYENSANMMDIRVNSVGTQYFVGHSIMPSLVHMLDVCVLAGLPAAVFSLAFRKSMPWPSCILPMATTDSLRVRPCWDDAGIHLRRDHQHFAC